MHTFTADNLTTNEMEIIEEELQTLKKIKEEIAGTLSRRKLNLNIIGDRLRMLREEAAKAKEADLPALFDQMNTNRAIIEHQPVEAFSNLASPYFARMRLKESGRTKDILLGPQTFLDGSIPIIDWRHAPISRIFFTYKEGEEYEETLPGRVAQGTLLTRNIITIIDGKLVQIKTQAATYFCDKTGVWQKNSRMRLGATELSGGAGSATRSTSRLGTGQTSLPVGEVAALLDPDQFAILDETGDDPLLILGGAGCGKTTVALHRMAMLHYRKPDFYQQNSMIALVPEEGLSRLTRKLLDTLALAQVAAPTFDHWIAARGHQLIKGLPLRLCQHTPAAIIHYKRHPAIRAGFQKLVQNRAAKIAAEIQTKYPERSAVADYLRNSSDLPLIQRLINTQKLHLELIHSSKNIDKEQRERVIHKFYEEKRREILDSSADRFELFHSMDIIKTVIAAAGGDIARGVAETLYHHSLAQFARPSKTRYHGIDEERLTTVDGKSLLDDDDDDIADTIDAEDFSILMDLLHYKTGHSYTQFDRLAQYHHMVLDEAQELATIELAVIGRCLATGASITISGDAAQQIDPSTTFQSWEVLLSHLGLPAIAPHHLTTNYRSTKPIMDYAFTVLGPLSPRERPTIIKDGKPVKKSLYPNDGCAAVDMIEELTGLVFSEPTASIAVIAKDMSRAQKYFDMLKSVPNIRLIQDGTFEFRPGIDVTDVSQVKGLEFDYVIIPDASLGIYRDKDEDRRILHVAVTRAIHQLWVIAIEAKSLIIPEEEEVT